MSLYHSDPSFKEPTLCKACGKHYAYKFGRCYECFNAECEEHADQVREERKIAEHFGDEQ